MAATLYERHRPGSRHHPLRPPLLRPGWAITFTFAFFPLWWVLGVSAFIGIVASAFMIVELLHRRRIQLPTGIGLWAMFLVTVAVGVLVLQVDVPGAVPGGSGGRYATWAFRLSWYIAATVAMVYVGNLRHELSTVSVARKMSIMFLTVAAGGWLGMLFPHLEFRSVLEMILPHNLTSIDFVRFLVHPRASQLYEGAATDTPRPSAPFAYSNIWGLNFALFLPFFVYAWFGREARWRRRLAPVLLPLSLVPAIASLNRGLWLALIAMLVFVAIRAAVVGHNRVLIAVCAAAALGTIVILTTPAADLIAHRLDNPTSNDTRTNLGAQTIVAVSRSSPIVGVGTTRDVQGSFTSIAGGATRACPLCAPPALGTQGHLWLVVFSQGFLGLILYLAFHGRWLLAGLRSHGVASTVGTCAILAHLVTMPVYDSIGTSQFAVMIGMGFIWRDIQEARRSAPRPGYARVGAEFAPSFSFVRRHLVLLLLLTAFGGVVATSLQVFEGVRAVGRVSVFLPEEESYLLGDNPARTLDTEAALAADTRVLAAAAGAARQDIQADQVFVSVDPNTRILNLRVVGSGLDAVRAGTAAAADTVLRARLDDMVARQRSAKELVARQADQVEDALTLVDRQIAFLAEGQKEIHRNLLVSLRSTRARLVAETGRLNSRLARLSNETPIAGNLVRPATVYVSYDGWKIHAASGLVLGLLVGVGAGRMVDSRGARVGRGHRVSRTTGLAVWGHVRATSGSSEEPALTALLTTLHGRRIGACLPVNSHPVARSAARRLDETIGESARRVRPGDVILVVAGTQRIPEVIAEHHRLTRAGVNCVGVVTTEG